MKMLLRTCLVSLFLAPAAGNCADVPPLTPAGAAGLGAATAIAAGAVLLNDKKSVFNATGTTATSPANATSAANSAGGQTSNTDPFGHPGTSHNGGDTGPLPPGQGSGSTAGLEVIFIAPTCDLVCFVISTIATTETSVSTTTATSP
jgi:hypothetical protein